MVTRMTVRSFISSAGNMKILIIFQTEFLINKTFQGLLYDVIPESVANTGRVNVRLVSMETALHVQVNNYLKSHRSNRESLLTSFVIGAYTGMSTGPS